MGEALSVIIIAKNAERSLTRTLDSVAWADEIILVDAESTDRTRVIAEDANASWSKRIKVYTRAWTGFRDQRNFSLQKATHRWIFSIDADEACSPALKEALEHHLRSAEAGPGAPA